MHRQIGAGLVAGGSSALNQTSFLGLGRVPTLRQRVENQVAPGQEPIVVAVGRALSAPSSNSPVVLVNPWGAVPLTISL